MVSNRDKIARGFPSEDFSTKPPQTPRQIAPPRPYPWLPTPTSCSYLPRRPSRPSYWPSPRSPLNPRRHHRRRNCRTRHPHRCDAVTPAALRSAALLPANALPRRVADAIWGNPESTPQGRLVPPGPRRAPPCRPRRRPKAPRHHAGRSAAPSHTFYSDSPASDRASPASDRASPAGAGAGS